MKVKRCKVGSRLCVGKAGLGITRLRLVSLSYLFGIPSRDDDETAISRMVVVGSACLLSNAGGCCRSARIWLKTFLRLSLLRYHSIVRHVSLLRSLSPWLWMPCCTAVPIYWSSRVNKRSRTQHVMCDRSRVTRCIYSIVELRANIDMRMLNLKISVRPVCTKLYFHRTASHRDAARFVSSLQRQAGYFLVSHHVSCKYSKDRVMAHMRS